MCLFLKNRDSPFASQTLNLASLAGLAAALVRFKLLVTEYAITALVSVFASDLERMVDYVRQILRQRQELSIGAVTVRAWTRFLLQEGLSQTELTEIGFTLLATEWPSQQVPAQLALKEVQMLLTFLQVRDPSFPYEAPRDPV